MPARARIRRGQAARSGAQRREHRPGEAGRELYLYEGPNVAAVASGAGVASVERRFVYDGVDHPLWMWDRVADAGVYFELDCVGNVRRLRGGARYGAGAALPSDLGGYKYTAFGRSIAADAGTPAPVVDGVSFAQPLRWQGRWLDTATGIYDVRNRQWSPELGAFLSADEFGFSRRTATLWSWPGQNPLRWGDPLGRAGIAIGGAGFGALWGPGGGAGGGFYVDVSSSGVEVGSYGSGTGGYGLGVVGSAGVQATLFTDLASFGGTGVGVDLELGSFSKFGVSASTPLSSLFSGGTISLSASLGAGAWAGGFLSHTLLAPLWKTPVPSHPGAAPAPAPGATPVVPPPPPPNSCEP